MKPLPLETTVEILKDYEDKMREARIRIAIGKGIYPTAWGYSTPLDWWESDGGNRTLNFYLDKAMKNIKRYL